MNIEKAKIYGVDKVGSSNPAALVRTDDAVGLSYTVGTSEIKSDFDRCFPWCDMIEIMDNLSNIFIKIPKFYCKITKNADGTYKHQISGVRYDGFSTLFIDGKGNELDYILVGKYEASIQEKMAFSRSGATVATSYTMETIRTACRQHGAGYQQYDFLIDLIIKELWLVEIKTTNSQSIMQGYTTGSNSAAITTGHTDLVKTPSGSEVSNTDGAHAMKYRGIENLWGNVYKWVDGITFSAEKVYVCTDPISYSSGKITAPYVYQGNRVTTSSNITKIEPLDRNPLIQYATAASGGSSTTYYSDYTFYSSSGSVLAVGGAWSYGADAGLWVWSGYFSPSSSSPVIGGRLCYKPL